MQDLRLGRHRGELSLNDHLPVLEYLFSSGYAASLWEDTLMHLVQDFAQNTWEAWMLLLTTAQRAIARRASS
jgi:hypothetical protein